MGHASVTVTFDRYGHLFEGAASESTELLDAYLARAAGQARDSEPLSDAVESGHVR
jgi:integrase